MSEPLPPPATLSFEQSLSELQKIVSDLESGALGLEPSLARFEHGIGLLKTCYATLERAEQRIEILTGIDAQGHAKLAPFDASATASTQGLAAGRRTRRKPSRTASDDPPEAPTPGMPSAPSADSTATDLPDSDAAPPTSVPPPRRDDASSDAPPDESSGRLF